MNYLLYSTTILICFHKEKQLPESLCVSKGMPGLLRMYDDVGLVRDRKLLWHRLLHLIDC